MVVRGGALVGGGGEAVVVVAAESRAVSPLSPGATSLLAGHPVKIATSTTAENRWPNLFLHIGSRLMRLLDWLPAFISCQIHRPHTKGP